MFKQSLYAVLTVLLLASCQNPTENISLHFAPKVYEYAMALEIYDLSNPDALYEGNVSIEVIGPDANKIYAADGSRNYEAHFGRVLLITDAAGEPTAGNPLDFSVRVKSSQHEEQVVHYTIQQGDTYVNLPTYLISTSNPPQGLVSSSTTASLNTNGELTQPLSFSTNAAGTAEPLSINIPTGVNFLDANGNVLTGSDLSIEVRSYDASVDGINRAMPNQGIMVKNVNGQRGLSVLFPDANFSIDMTVGNVEVKRFTGSGIELKMPVPSSMYNFNENRHVQAGDLLEVVSYSDGDDNWVSEGTVAVVEENAELWVKAVASHLSSYAVDQPSSASMELTLIDNLDNKNLVDNSEYQFIRTDGRNASRYKVIENRNYNRNNWNGNQTKLFFYKNSLTEIKFFPSDQFEITVSGENVNFGATPNNVKVGYTLRCAGEEATYQPFYGSIISYRKTGTSDAYKAIYTFTSKNAANTLHTFQGLQDGVTYDFKVNWFSLELYQTSLTIKDGEIYELELTDSECKSIGF